MANDDLITIYHIEGRRSFRIIWACEEIGHPYELIFKQGDLMGSMEMLKAVNPIIPMEPTVRYKGNILVESGAIVELVQTRYGKGRLAPEIDSEDYPLHLQWMHFAEATAQYRAWAIRFASMISGIPADQIPSTLNGFRLVGLQEVCDYMEDHLSRHPYFGGKQFSGADIMMQFSIVSSKLTGGFDPQNFRRIQEWKQRVEGRPAFARARKAAVPGGSDEHGLPVGMPLPFPEPTRPLPVPTVR